MGIAPRSYHTLDGLRGVAALAVVLVHLQFYLSPQLPAPRAGWLAVDLFFVLSGFIVAHAYEAKLERGLGVGSFLLIRVVRFLPLFGLGLALGAVKAAVEQLSHSPSALTPKELIATLTFNLFFLPAPPFAGRSDLFVLNAPAWSLFFEMVINALYAVTIQYLSNRRLVMIAAASAVGLMIASLTPEELNGGMNWGDLWVGAVRVGYSFPIGVLLYRHRHRGAAIEMPPVAILLLLAVLLSVPFAGAAEQAYNLIFILLLSPAVVLLGSASEPQRGLGLFAYVGGLSYCVYIIHWPLVTMARGVVRVFHVSPLPLAGVIVAGLLVACPILVRTYDEPGRVWLRRLIEGRERVG
jgi:peptidoglycan/LPS O-acetylase OafA/YrhL